jgi:hypothetical protein
LPTGSNEGEALAVARDRQIDRQRQRRQPRAVADAGRARGGAPKQRQRRADDSLGLAGPGAVAARLGGDHGVHRLLVQHQHLAAWQRRQPPRGGRRRGDRVALRIKEPAGEHRARLDLTDQRPARIDLQQLGAAEAAY